MIEFNVTIKVERFCCFRFDFFLLIDYTSTPSSNNGSES